MPLLPRPQALHDVADIEAHCRSTISRALGKNGGYLEQDQRDELLAYLLSIAARLSRRYDPTRSSLSFSSFCAKICERRVVDWYRKELGDSRYGRRPTIVSLEGIAASTGRSIAEVIGRTSEQDIEEVGTLVSLAL